MSIKFQQYADDEISDSTTQMPPHALRPHSSKEPRHGVIGFHMPRMAPSRSSTLKGTGSFRNVLCRSKLLLLLCLKRCAPAKD